MEIILTDKNTKNGKQTTRKLSFGFWFFALCFFGGGFVLINQQVPLDPQTAMILAMMGVVFAFDRIQVIAEEIASEKER